MSPARLQPQERGDQRIDIFTGIVESQRRPYRAFNSHAAQDRLGTVADKK